MFYKNSSSYDKAMSIILSLIIFTQPNNLITTNSKVNPCHLKTKSLQYLM